MTPVQVQEALWTEVPTKTELRGEARRLGSGQNFALQIIYLCSPFLHPLRSGVSSL